MRKIAGWVLLLVLAASCVAPSAFAEESTGFFGFKKNKGIPATPPKKKLKGIPANPVKATSADGSELTDDEKKMVAEMAAKTPWQNTGKGHEAVTLPPEALVAMTPPRAPVTTPPQPPSVPVDPNRALLRIPQAPSRAPLVPTTSGPKPPVTSNKKNY